MNRTENPFFSSEITSHSPTQLPKIARSAYAHRLYDDDGRTVPHTIAIIGSKSQGLHYPNLVYFFPNPKDRADFIADFRRHSDLEFKVSQSPNPNHADLVQLRRDHARYAEIDPLLADF